MAICSCGKVLKKITNAHLKTKYHINNVKNEGIQEVKNEGIQEVKNEEKPKKVKLIVPQMFQFGNNGRVKILIKKLFQIKDKIDNQQCNEYINFVVNYMMSKGYETKDWLKDFVEFNKYKTNWKKEYDEWIKRGKLWLKNEK